MPVVRYRKTMKRGVLVERDPEETVSLSTVRLGFGLWDLGFGIWDLFSGRVAARPS